MTETAVFDFARLSIAHVWASRTTAELSLTPNSGSLCRWVVLNKLATIICERQVYLNWPLSASR